MDEIKALTEELNDRSDALKKAQAAIKNIEAKVRNRVTSTEIVASFAVFFLLNGGMR